MATQMDAVSMRELTEHIRNHMRYPATKREIVEECNRMSHVPAETRRMVETQLPEGSYQSADEVMRALGI